MSNITSGSELAREYEKLEPLSNYLTDQADLIIESQGNLDGPQYEQLIRDTLQTAVDTYGK